MISYLLKNTSRRRCLPLLATRKSPWCNQKISSPYYHGTAPVPVHYSSKNDDEERMIGQAIRFMRERKSSSIKVVVEVMNSFHVERAADLIPCKDLLDHRESSHRIRILTRTDHLSREALQYQMHRASSSSSGENGDMIAVVAMDLSDAELVGQRILGHTITFSKVFCKTSKG